MKYPGSPFRAALALYVPGCFGTVTRKRTSATLSFGAGANANGPNQVSW